MRSVEKFLVLGEGGGGHEAAVRAVNLQKKLYQRCLHGKPAG